MRKEKVKNKYNEFETKLTELITEYTDELMPLQIIGLLEAKKLTLAHLFIQNGIAAIK